MTFAPAFVFLSVLNVYSFAIEFGGRICYFQSKWISRAKFFTFPGDGRPRRGWIACNMQWLFLLFWMKNLLQNDEVIQNFEVWTGVEKRGQEWKNTFLWHHQPPVMQNFGILLVYLKQGWQINIWTNFLWKHCPMKAILVFKVTMLQLRRGAISCFKLMGFKPFNTFF